MISPSATTLPSFSTQLRTVAQQAWPVLISQWTAVAFEVLDTAMVGHTSPANLAAMSLSISIYMTVFVGMMGIIYALIPLLAHQYGAGRYTEMGPLWGQGIWLSLALSVLGAGVLLFPDVWLSWSGDLAPEVRAITQSYLQILACTLPAALLFRTLYALCAAISRTRGIMLITLGGVAFKAFFNWLLIYGHWNFPALGANGAALATALVSWISLGLILGFIAHDPFYQRFSLSIGKLNWASQKQLLRLGLPMGAAYLVEACGFTFMSLLIAREGVYSLSGHQILSNVAEICYMIPMAIGVATTALTAQALGADQLALARQRGHAGLTLTFLGALLTVIFVWKATPLLLKIYTNNVPITHLVTALLPLFPLYHLADSMQCIATYLLRAYQVVLIPLLIQTTMLGGFAVIGGWWLGFGPAAGGLDGLRMFLIPGSPVGAGTVWLMAMLGLGFSGVLLNGWYWQLARRGTLNKVYMRESDAFL